MDKNILEKITEKLRGLNWFAFSGFAVEVYSNGKRKARDIDLVLFEKEIDIFAKRIGVCAKNRKIDKKNFFVEDYGFETEFEGQAVEATNGYPIKRVKEKTFNKLFERKIKIQYLGCEVYLAPIEELIVGKAYMARKKDLKDLKLFKNEKIDIKFLHELANDWNNYDKIVSVLREVGYSI